MARLSARTRTRSSSELEDLGWFESFTDIPSKDTVQYMANAYVVSSPDRKNCQSCIRLLSSLLESWDQELVNSATYLHNWWQSTCTERVWPLCFLAYGSISTA